MKTLTEQLVNYARYHRDARNIATHFVGIPMIVVAIAVLLSRPSMEWAGVPVSLATVIVGATLVYYFVLDGMMGALMTVLLGLTLWFAHWSAAQSTAVWLTIGVGGFLVGWVIQFVGHFYEGRKPAFFDDIIGLIIGPLFVLAEVLFKLGIRTDLQARIDQQAGPVRA